MVFLSSKNILQTTCEKIGMKLYYLYIYIYIYMILYFLCVFNALLYLGCSRLPTLACIVTNSQ